MHIFVEPLPGILLLDLLFGFPHLVVHTSNCTFKNAPFASTFSLVVPCSHESEHIKLMTSLIFNSVLPVFYRQTLPSDEINTFQLEGDQYSFKCSYFPMCLPQPVSISRFLFKASSRLECANPPPLIALDPLFSKFCAVRSRASQWKRRPQFQLPNCCSKPPPLFWVSKSAPAESETLTPLFWNLHAVHRMTHPRNHPPAPFTASKPPPLFWVFKPSPTDHSRPFVFSNFHSVSRMASPQKRPPASRDKAGVSLSWCPPGL